MEGAVLSGKLAAEVVADRALGNAPAAPKKPIEAGVLAKAKSAKPKAPLGILGPDVPITFGGGQILGDEGRQFLKDFDAAQLDSSGDTVQVDRRAPVAK